MMENEIIEYTPEPGFLAKLAQSAVARFRGVDILAALKKANTKKRIDNGPLFDAVDFLDGEIKPLAREFENMRKRYKAPFLAGCRAVDNLFKGAPGRVSEPTELEALRNEFEKAIIDYQTRTRPEEKTIRTDNGVSATLRVTKGVRVKDEVAFAKACVSTAKNNEAYVMDFLKIDYVALKKAFDAEPDKYKKFVEYEYKTGLV